MRTVLALFAVSSLALPGDDRVHPEWGPAPPVAPYGMSELPSEHVVIPLIFPVLGESRWVDGYGENRGSFKHTGIDIRAPKMTPIVAPFAGKIGMKKETFWIYADNGWAMLGTHLNDDNIGKHDHAGDRDVMFAPNVAPDQRVAAGQFIGYVGESGDATAPHLHFEIYAPGDGPTMGRIRNPFPSLKAAKVITTPAPSPARNFEKPKSGEVRIDGCIRRSNLHDNSLTLIVVDTQLPGAAVQVSTKLRYERIKLSPEALLSAGGWSTLRTLQPFDTVEAFVPAAPAQERIARRLVVETH